ncbi:MAG: SsrA-binding protein [Phycisphaerae bacterium]|nr:SsrA-binding protein [Phycisphaerae bacterium]
MGKGPLPSPRINNRKAKFDFDILESLEAGISLTGSEVKSLRAAQASLDEAYARFRGDELFLVGCNISPYPLAGYAQHEPTRERKLLLHRRELRKFHKAVTQRGFTMIPLAIYFTERGICKVTVALAKGKTHGDKRASLKERDQKREMARAMRRR